MERTEMKTEMKTGIKTEIIHGNPWNKKIMESAII